MTIRQLRCIEFWDEYMGNLGYQIEDFFEEKCLDRCDIVDIQYAVVYDSEQQLARSYALLTYEYEPIELQFGEDNEDDEDAEDIYLSDSEDEETD